MQLVNQSKLGKGVPDPSSDVRFQKQCGIQQNLMTSCVHTLANQHLSLPAMREAIILSPRTRISMFRDASFYLHNSPARRYAICSSNGMLSSLFWLDVGFRSFFQRILPVRVALLCSRKCEISWFLFCGHWLSTYALVCMQRAAFDFFFSWGG